MGGRIALVNSLHLMLACSVWVSRSYIPSRLIKGGEPVNDFDPSRIPGYATKKSYAHFDYRVAFKDVEARVCDADFIQRHAFLPLIANKLCHVRFWDGKKTLKTRDIAYASHLDHRIFQYYALQWGKLYDRRALETGIGGVAAAYRSGFHLTNYSVAADAIDAIRRQGDSLVITGDFTHFFDNLDHSYLRKAVRGFFNEGMLPPDHYQVLKNILHYCYWPVGDLVRRNGLCWIDLQPDDPFTFGNSASKVRFKALRSLNRLPRILTPAEFSACKDSSIVVPWKERHDARGIPQGLATSGVLANMYMFDIDAQINACVASVNGRYIRYCDDLIIVVPAKDLKTASKALALAQGVPAVELQDEKTKIHRVNDGKVEQLSFDALLAGEMEVVRTAHHAGNHVSFLGFDFDGKDVRIRQSTVGRFYSRFYRAAKSIGRLADNPDKHPSKKRVSALYEHYSPKGSRSSDKRGASEPSCYGNYLSYVARAQKAFPNDPISGHVSKMYRKINKATSRG